MKALFDKERERGTDISKKRGQGQGKKIIYHPSDKKLGSF